MYIQRFSLLLLMMIAPLSMRGTVNDQKDRTIDLFPEKPSAWRSAGQEALHFLDEVVSLKKHGHLLYTISTKGLTAGVVERFKVQLGTLALAGGYIGYKMQKALIIPIGLYIAAQLSRWALKNVLEGNPAAPETDK